MSVSAAGLGAGPGGVYMTVGGVLYLAGTFLVTAVFNVPMNDALEEGDPTGPDAASTWRTYVEKWTAWTHMRSVPAVMGASCSCSRFSLRQGPRPPPARPR
ncbi:hypothetical protein BSZ35_18725 [Salinibacter sp. 10B]|nr:hypothetical protein BSZ35_18725 [Salinibacter sp. 10B]